MTRPAEAPVWDACACVDMRAGKLCQFLRLGDGRLGNLYFTGAEEWACSVVTESEMTF